MFLLLFNSEEAVFIGSTPSHIPSQTQAVSTQPPGHIGSMPHCGRKNLHANAGWAAEQPASGGGSSSTLDQDIAQYRRLVETLRGQGDEELFCVEQRTKEEIVYSCQFVHVILALGPC